MTTIDYKKVKCPKCGKSYFRIKENSGVNFTTLVFTTKPDPIYKDGELQNPTEAEPIKVRCECLECGCNFRVETHDVFGDYRFIDEEAELEEAKRKLSESCKLKMAAEPVKEVKSEFTIDAPGQIRCKTVEIGKLPSFTIKSFQETVKEELDEIRERLAKLEERK